MAWEELRRSYFCPGHAPQKIDGRSHQEFDGTETYVLESV